MRKGLLVGTAIALAGCSRDSSPAAAPAPAPPAAVTFERTTFAVHTRVPIEPGKNVIWCATLQLAWDALADAVGGGRVELEPPASAEEVAELNRRTFPHADLDPASFVAAGGWVRDDVFDRIRKEMAAKFPSEPAPAPSGGPQDAVGFAYLAKDLAFEFPFEDLAEPMRFAGGSRYVQAFGLESDAKGAVAERALAQVVWYWPPHGKASQGVIEIRLTSSEDRLILSRIAQPTTLEEGWRETAEILEKGAHQTFEPHNQEFALPKIDFDAVHEFAQFHGAAFSRVPGSRMQSVTQQIRFRLDRTGAILRSEAEMRLSMGGVDQTFDQPFLLALVRKDAARPYLLLWLGNDDLLAAAPATPPAAVSPFVGAWTASNDREALTLTIREDRTATLEVRDPFGGHRTDAAVEAFATDAYFVPSRVDGKAAEGPQRRRIRMKRTEAGLAMVKPEGSRTWDFVRAP